MDQTQALAIVRSLANGVDPQSGEVFPCPAAMSDVKAAVQSAVERSASP